MTDDRKQLLQAALIGLDSQIGKLQDQKRFIEIELAGQPAKKTGPRAVKPAKTGKRQMSAEGRERIAAATRKRWKEFRKAKKAAPAAAEDVAAAS